MVRPRDGIMSLADIVFLWHSMGWRQRVLVGAPGKASRKYQQPSTVSHEQILPTLRHLFANFSEMARVLSRQNL